LFLLFSNFSFIDNIVMHLCPWPHSNRRTINSMMMMIWWWWWYDDDHDTL